MCVCELMLAARASPAGGTVKLPYKRLVSLSRRTVKEEHHPMGGYESYEEEYMCASCGRKYGCTSGRGYSDSGPSSYDVGSWWLLEEEAPQAQQPCVEKMPQARSRGDEPAAERALTAGAAADSTVAGSTVADSTVADGSMMM